MNNETIKLIFNGTNSSYILDSLLSVNNYPDIISSAFMTDDEEFYKINKNAIIKFHTEYKKSYTNNEDKKNLITYNWNLLAKCFTNEDWKIWANNFDDKKLFYKKLENNFLNNKNLSEIIKKKYILNKFLSNINKENVKNTLLYFKKEKIPFDLNGFDISLICKNINETNSYLFIELMEKLNVNLLSQPLFNSIFFNNNLIMNKKNVDFFINKLEQLSFEEKKKFFSENEKILNKNNVFGVYLSNLNKDLLLKNNKLNINKEIVNVLKFANERLPETLHFTFFEFCVNYFKGINNNNYLFDIEKILQNQKVSQLQYNIKNFTAIKNFYEKQKLNDLLLVNNNKKLKNKI